MNEAETRAELIDPKLRESGWGRLEGTRVRREFRIAPGRILSGGRRGRPTIADYVLEYRGVKLAVIEAKAEGEEVGEGVGQAKTDAGKLQIDMTYATNGHEIYVISMATGEEGLVERFPTPQELWDRAFPPEDDASDEANWLEAFNAVPFEDMSGTKPPYFYQELAVNRVLEGISEGKDRLLLTLATGTGKTYIAFQIAWKLFYARWNLRRDGARRPRILFLADRNILADQAFNAFTAFPEDALLRIDPKSIRKKGSVPTNGSIFFTIFQTFMSGPGETAYFGDYPADFFDLIIVDECHRGGARDESTWRAILEYFSPAVQLGLTATPKRDVNVDTYDYFGRPVYTYSLREGINDGFLTPFKVRRFQTTMDDYVYTDDDTVLSGEVEEGRIYSESDFNRNIRIDEREAARVRIFLSEIDQTEKTIVFCADYPHPQVVRDLINQNKESTDPNYCVRVTSRDGARGEEHLRTFQDNDKTIPTILTTSEKLSTGVDARNVRNIVLMRPVNSIIEFKQIVGRGTRVYDGKDYFTIYDFVGAYKNFSDPEWDGEPLEPEPRDPREPLEPLEPEAVTDPDDPERPKKLRIRLRDGKAREIQHMGSTSFWSSEGKPVSAQQFIENLFGKLPEFFRSEEELRQLWSDPQTRQGLLESLGDAGFGTEELRAIQRLIDAANSDLFDVLEYIAFAAQPMSRAERVELARPKIFAELDAEQQAFISFVLSQYVELGVGELAQDKLADLLTLKYEAIADATAKLGDVNSIRSTFIDFQKHLYEGA